MLNQKIKTKQTFRKVVDRTTTEIITKHPRLFIIAIGFAITLIVGTAIGMVNRQKAFAIQLSDNP